MSEAIEASFETGYDTDGVLGDVADTDYWKAQRFTTSATIICSAGSLYITGSVGSPTGDMTFRIETDVGNEPSGTLVHANATATIANGEITTSAWNKCPFTVFSLAAGTYWLVEYVPNQATNVRWHHARDDNGVGVNAYSADGGTNWTTRTNEYMAYFRVYRSTTLSINVHDCTDLKEKVGG